MSITLVTGTPGAGKSLRAVSVHLPAEVGRVIRDGDKEVKRRIMVGGIPALLIDHEPIDVPHLKEGDKDDWTGIERKPGEPPHDVPHRADNWWLWCMPGDLIVVDECWRVFRAMPAGRRLPDYLDKLAVHRHYGVDFLLISQGPAQLHVFLRSLVDRHEFVRRLFRGGRTIVYEWDHCASHTALKSAMTKTFWSHDKKAFSLYASSQLHVKGTAGVPFALWLLIAIAVLLPLIAYFAWSRYQANLHQFDKPKAAQADGPVASSKPGAVHTAGTPMQAASAAFIAPVGLPAYTTAVPPRKTWPEAVAGCWQHEDGCSCVTQEMPPRVISDRPAMCAAVVAGDVVPPLSHPRPVRTEPEPQPRTADGQDGSQAPAKQSAQGQT